MATVGSLVVPVSADVAGLQKGLRIGQKEIKMFAREISQVGKTIGRIEHLGVGGVLGGLVGGPMGGFIGQKLDDAIGITDQLMETTKGFAKEQFGRSIGVDFKAVDAAEAKQTAAIESSKQFAKQEQSLRLQNAEMTEGAEAAFRLKAVMEGRSEVEVKILETMFKQNMALRDQAKAAAEAEAANKARGGFLFGLNIREREIGLDPIEKQIRAMARMGFGEQDQMIARGMLKNIKEAEDQLQLADRLHAELGKAAPDGPVAALRKGSAAEFSALQKLRRELDKLDKADPTPEEIAELRKRLEKDDAKREKQLDDIKAALKNPPIKQANFN